MQDGRGHRPWSYGLLREQFIEFLPENQHIQPAERRDEDELQLRSDGTRDAHEQVVEPSVVEVILYSRAADPADATVDDEGLAMVDASRVGRSSTEWGRRPRRGWTGARSCDGPDDPDVDARGEKSLVERAATPVGIRALAIDDDSDRNPVGGLRSSAPRRTRHRSNPAGNRTG